MTILNPDGTTVKRDGWQTGGQPLWCDRMSLWDRAMSVDRLTLEVYGTVAAIFLAGFVAGAWLF